MLRVLTWSQLPKSVFCNLRLRNLPKSLHLSNSSLQNECFPFGVLVDSMTHTSLCVCVLSSSSVHTIPHPYSEIYSDMCVYVYRYFRCQSEYRDIASYTTYPHTGSAQRSPHPYSEVVKQVSSNGLCPVNWSHHSVSVHDRTCILLAQGVQDEAKS